MDAITTVNLVKDILNSDKNIHFIEYVWFGEHIFRITNKRLFFYEKLINKIKAVENVECYHDAILNMLIIKVKFKTTQIKLEQKYTEKEIKDKIKAIKRVKPISQSKNVRKFPKYRANMSMQDYYLEYIKINNGINLLELNSDMTHKTSLYNNNQTDFDVIRETTDCCVFA